MCVNMNRVARYAGGLVLCVCIGAALAFAVTAVREPTVRSSAGRIPTLAADTLQPFHEVVAVFIGASYCISSNTDGLDQDVNRLRDILESRARDGDQRVVTIGVALDRSVDDGLSFLNRFGEFDELIVGRNWLNTAAEKYLWKDHPGVPTLPQVVVVQREVDVSSIAITFGEEEPVLRLVGAGEIRAWVRANSAEP